MRIRADDEDRSAFVLTPTALPCPLSCGSGDAESSIPVQWKEC